MALITFSPPGFVDDLDAAGRRSWHELISDFMDNAKAGDPSVPFSSPRPQFFNPAKTAIGADSAIEDVKWTAFPRLVAVQSGSDHQRWQNADSSRGVQDEYCEWSIKRDGGNKIATITFTCEGPEYWGLLAQLNPAKVLELYRMHIDPSVAKNDLFAADGTYIRDNRFNNSVTSGAMHLIQRNNTLGAEVEIAGAATIVRRKPDGSVMTDTRELIECGKYGEVERNSDPFIGARVNFHARNKSDVTISDPIGIYFSGLDTQGWTTPDGADPSTFWRITRGTQDRPVRAVLEVPAGKSYVLGDVKIDGKPILFGGQVADHIQMTIRALATRIGQSSASPVQGCVGAAGMPGAEAAAAHKRPSRIR
jgi:hypothetical protein